MGVLVTYGHGRLIIFIFEKLKELKIWELVTIMLALRMGIIRKDGYWMKILLK
jgi:hypothetical protein